MKSVLSLSAAIFLFLPVLAVADCLPALAGDNRFLCTSYDFNLPVSIASSLSTPAFTVVGGNAGIGTTSPTNLFTVQGSSGANGTSLSVIRTTGVENTYGLSLDSSGAGNNNFGFSKNGVAKAGFGYDGGRNFIGFFNTAYSSNDFAFRVNSDGSMTYHDGASSAERFRVTSAGNVGIGTSTPGFSGYPNTLSIYSPGARGSLEIASGQADGTNVASARIGFFATSNTGGNGIQISSILNSTEGTTANDRGGVMQFFTKSNGAGNFERMRINSVGMVGINTTAPVTALDINGAMRLARNSSAPYTCGATYDGVIALTHVYTTCVCNGSAWVLTSNGTTACAW